MTRLQPLVRSDFYAWGRTCLLSLLLWCEATSALAAYPQKNCLLVLGLGSVGRAVAEQALVAGDYFDTVYGTVRSSQDGDEDSSGSLQQLVFSQANLSQRLPFCTHALVTIPCSPEKDPVLESVWESMEQLLPNGAWVGFVSTTGVYGNHNGAWVTEESPLLCEEGSQASLYRDEELSWKERANTCGWNVSVFRCAGIYGPRRSALHTVYKNGYVPPNEQVTGEENVTNRIHEHDIARAIVASMKMHSIDTAPTICVYNLADDEPESRYVVMRYAAHLLEARGVSIRENQQQTSKSSERGRRRRLNRKLVSNVKMRNELLKEFGGSLMYPTYREGFASILRQPNNPWSHLP